MNDSFVIDPNAPKPFTQGNGTIVIVDDDPGQLQLLTYIYQKTERSNPLICLQSGNDLINYIEKVRDNIVGMPEVILLDINMPDLSGFDVLKKLRATEEFKKHPPIIMFTSSESMSDIIKAKNLKADAYCTKPVGVNMAMNLLSNI